MIDSYRNAPLTVGVSAHRGLSECARPDLANMPKGHLQLNVNDAELESGLKGTSECYVVASVPGDGRAVSRTAPVSGTENACVWHQQLKLDVKPDSKAVELHLYGRSQHGDDLLASGSYSLRGLFEADDQVATVPLVGTTGKHAGELRVRMIFIRPRSTGKERDPLGREVLNGTRRSSSLERWPDRFGRASSGATSPVY